MRRPKTTSTTALVIMLTLLLTLPVFWLLLSSFKSRLDLLSSPPQLLFTPTLAHYQKAFVARGFADDLLNSTAVALGSSLLAVLLAYPAALVLERSPRALRDHLLFFILSTRLVPPVALGLPLYLLYRDWHLLDTRLGLIIAHTAFNLSFAVWMAVAYLRRLVSEVYEAARLDGLGPARLAWVLVPVMRGPLLMVWLFCFAFSWNELFLGSILATDQARTLPVATLGLVTSQGTYWGQFCAVAVVTLAPAFLFALILRPAAGTLFSLGGVEPKESGS